MKRQDAEKLAIKLGLSTWDMGDDGFGGEDVPNKKAVELLMQYEPAPSPAQGTPEPPKSESSRTYGELPGSIRNVIEPHEWDNKNISEQRDYALDMVDFLERELGNFRRNQAAALAGPQNGQGWLPDIDVLAKECARLGYLPDMGTLQFALTAIFNLRNALPAPPTGDAPPVLHDAILAGLPCSPIELLKRLYARDFSESEVKIKLAEMLDPYHNEVKLKNGLLLAGDAPTEKK